MRILVADDNSLVRSGITEILNDNAWEVCGEASDGAEALQKARELKPDLVLLDVSMPGTNGLEIAKAIRRELPGVAIVLVSQHDLSNLLGGTQSEWADGFVDKNRIGRDLVPTVRRLLDNSVPGRRNSRSPHKD
jgi:DNA-binding NarL/FixJ family response regulator